MKLNITIKKGVFIMKYLLSVLLIILFSTSISVAGMRMRGTVNNEMPNGETIKVEFFGDILMSADGIMSNALTRGWGQFLHSNSDDDFELRTSSEISAITKKAIELKFNDNVKTFLITPKTIFCDLEGKKIRLKTFRVEDMVTVSSGVDDNLALSIRMGPMYFTGVMAGSPKLKDLDCIR